MRGTVVDVYDRAEDTGLAADATTGAGTLELLDVQFFREVGGTARVADDNQADTITYTGYDDDTYILAGVSGLAHDYDADTTTVTPLPAHLTRYAEVQELDEDDTLQVRVPHHLYAHLKPRTFDHNADETVEVTFREDVKHSDEYVLQDILGIHPFVREPEYPYHFDGVLPLGPFTSPKRARATSDQLIWGFAAQLGTAPATAPVVLDLIKRHLATGLEISVWATNPGNRPTFAVGQADLFLDNSEGSNDSLFDSPNLPAGWSIHMVIVSSDGTAAHLQVQVATRVS